MMSYFLFVLLFKSAISLVEKLQRTFSVNLFYLLDYNLFTIEER